MRGTLDQMVVQFTIRNETFVFDTMVVFELIDGNHTSENGSTHWETLGPEVHVKDIQTVSEILPVDTSMQAICKLLPEMDVVYMHHKRPMHVTRMGLVEAISHFKSGTLVFNPHIQTEEFSNHLNDSPRNGNFAQARGAVYVRMALLSRCWECRAVTLPMQPISRHSGNRTVIRGECMSELTGNLFVVSAPSGAGKSSLLKALLELEPSLQVAVSHTTRPSRPGEVDGEHYHFVDQDEFTRMIGDGEFLEHAQVFDKFYGTSEAAVRGPLSRDIDLILEIDWQGARQVRHLFPNASTLFILPPSVEALRERLTGRGQDSDEIIERRMRDAVDDIAHYPEYDYLVVNDDFDTALAELRSIVVSHRLTQDVQDRRLQEQLSGLLGGARAAMP